MRYIYVIIALFFFGCKVDSETDSHYFEKKIDIDSLGTIQLKVRENLLGLKSINDGYDSLQIRIWYGENSSDEKLVILTKAIDKWAFSFFEFRVKSFDFNMKIDTIVSVVKKKLVIKGSGDSLLNMLDQTDFVNVSSLNDICKLYETEIRYWNDRYTFEIASPNKYRVYNSVTPCLNKYDFIEMENVFKFLSYVENQLDIDIGVNKKCLTKEEERWKIIKDSLLLNQ